MTSGSREYLKNTVFKGGKLFLIEEKIKLFYRDFLYEESVLINSLSKQDRY